MDREGEERGKSRATMQHCKREMQKMTQIIVVEEKH
jgi:hypothetical protein